MSIVEYSNQDAEAYGSLEITGTTYEVGFNALATLLGNLSGQVWLDFGSGAGRSAVFLKMLGAQRVLGVDHNPAMIAQARSQPVAGVDHVLIDDVVPCEDNAFDGAITCNAFVEMRSREEMKAVCAEVFRTLKPGAPFYVMTGNPAAVGYEYKSWRNVAPANPVSGQRVTCVINTPRGQVEVGDTFWTQDDYEAAIRGAGFSVRAVLTPTSSSAAFAGTAESVVGPFVIFVCKRVNRA